MAMSKRCDLIVHVKEITGNCPVYAVGDSFTIRHGYQLVCDKPVCMNALASLMPYYHALRVTEPGRWGLADRDDPSRAVIQCLDPAAHTGGNSGLFPGPGDFGTGGPGRHGCGLQGPAKKA